MTVYGKPGKRSCCFPPFPQTLEIDEADSHIPTATTTTTRINISSNRLGACPVRNNDVQFGILLFVSIRQAENRGGSPEFG